MVFPLSEDFKRAIKKSVQDKSAHLAAGKASSFENYKELAGEIRGLELAVKVFDEVAKRHGSVEDDEQH